MPSNKCPACGQWMSKTGHSCPLSVARPVRQTMLPVFSSPQPVSIGLEPPTMEKTYTAFEKLKEHAVPSADDSIPVSGKPLPAISPAVWERRIDEYQVFYRVKRAMPNARYSYIEEQYDILLNEARGRKNPSYHAKERLLARVAQQRMIRILVSRGGFVDLQPPGSQRDQYEMGEDGRPTTVWYASYGSNMSRERFMHYLQGGTPEGSPKQHYGARDPSEPSGDAKLVIPGVVHYACSSKAWGGGGSAFLDPAAEGSALGRAYRISSQQFDDVILQENNGDPSQAPVTVDLLKAIEEGSVTTKGRYGTLVHIGDYEGSPVFTLTGGFTIQDAMERKKTIAVGGEITEIKGREKIRKRQKRKVKAAKILRRIWIPIKPIPVDHDIRTNAPSQGYQAMMEKGLKDLGLDDVQVGRYFRGATGFPLPKPEKEDKKTSTVKVETKKTSGTEKSQKKKQ